MATIKSFTDISQSKKLAKILPLESADMWYSIVDNEPFVCLERHYEYEQIPCWSLAALLGVLPKGTNINTPSLINARYCCWNNYVTIDNTNPVDACYNMIIKLNELKML